MLTLMAQPAEQEHADLWTRYEATREAGLRDALILQYQPLVKYVIKRLTLSPSAVLEYDDLLSAGTIGLIEAVQRYEPSRGTPFMSYAITRIRGAILDAARAADRLPRSLRQKSREAGRAISRLTHELGRTPTDREVAMALGVSPAAYRCLMVESSRVTVSLDALSRGDADDDGGRAEFAVADPDDRDVAFGLEREDVRRDVRRAISRLPKRDQLLLGLYYTDGLSMREVGDVLGVTESRVSQLCTRALARLEQALVQRFAEAAA